MPLLPTPVVFGTAVIGDSMTTFNHGGSYIDVVYVYIGQKTEILISDKVMEFDLLTASQCP